MNLLVCCLLLLGMILGGFPMYYLGKRKGRKEK